jgi:hypothetical protein
MNILEQLTKTKINTSIPNPFEKDNVVAVRFNVRKVWPYGKDDKWTFSGSVEFKKGGTEGTHNIEAQDFPSLLQEMEKVLGDLK